jgi:hypothetical protein
MPKYLKERESGMVQLLMLASMSAAASNRIAMVVTALPEMGD